MDISTDGNDAHKFENIKIVQTHAFDHQSTSVEDAIGSAIDFGHPCVLVFSPTSGAFQKN